MPGIEAIDLGRSTRKLKEANDEQRMDNLKEEQREVKA
jgi:hypothetical protein